MYIHDSAWRSRVPRLTIEQQRAQAFAQMAANRERDEREAAARPFRFEDLEGKPEPEKWGPKYSKPAKSGKPVDRCPTNCASGQKYDFDAAKHRAKMKAEFTAAANADRRAWAFGNEIVEAYKAAMDAKRARLAREANALELAQAA